MNYLIIIILGKSNNNLRWSSVCYFCCCCCCSNVLPASLAPRPRDPHQSHHCEATCPDAALPSLWTTTWHLMIQNTQRKTWESVFIIYIHYTGKETEVQDLAKDVVCDCLTKTWSYGPDARGIPHSSLLNLSFAKLTLYATQHTPEQDCLHSATFYHL